MLLPFGGEGALASQYGLEGSGDPLDQLPSFLLKAIEKRRLCPLLKQPRG
jgi:hypothetical protein